MWKNFAIGIMVGASIGFFLLVGAAAGLAAGLALVGA